MDASNIVKEYLILCCLLRGTEPGPPRREHGASTTMLAVTDDYFIYVSMHW